MLETPKKKFQDQKLIFWKEILSLRINAYQCENCRLILVVSDPVASLQIKTELQFFLRLDAFRIIIQNRKVERIIKLKNERILGQIKFLQVLGPAPFWPSDHFFAIIIIPRNIPYEFQLTTRFFFLMAVFCSIFCDTSIFCIVQYIKIRIVILINKERIMVDNNRE